MGRTPDHVAGFFAGYAATPDIFAVGSDRKFADNVVAYYEHMRDNHVYASYAIVPPQIDRSKPAHKQSDPALYAGVVKERDDGIVISGAQQLATGAAISDVIHLSCIHPLQPGDENYANCLAVPVNAPGVKLYPRRPFALNATSSFDYPLSSRFDETDNYVVFDNVFVPWEHVFIYRNLEASRDQWWKTPSHLYGNHQAQTRYVTKLRFMLGLAQRLNEATGNIANPAVQVMMGELASIASIYEGMLLAHEVNAPIDANGVLWPSKTTLYSAMALQSELNGRMLEMIRELAGGAFFTRAVVGGRFRQRADRARHRALHAGRLDRRQDPRRAAAPDLGLHRLGVRQPPPAVREVLRRRLVPGEAERLPQLRLQARHRAGRQGAELAAGVGSPIRSPDGAKRHPGTGPAAHSRISLTLNPGSGLRSPGSHCCAGGVAEPQALTIPDRMACASSYARRSRLRL